MTDTLQEYVDYSVEIGQKQNVDLILAFGTQATNNQIRFSQNKIDITKQWKVNRIDLIVVVEGNQLSVSNFSPLDKKHVEERVNAQIKFTYKNFDNCM